MAQKSDQCVVLYYHGIAEKQTQGFLRQMRWLSSHGSIISLQSLMTKNWSGQKVCITFDDALDNVRQNALPILQEHNIPATIFAVSGNLGGEPAWTIDDSHPDRHEVLSTDMQLKEYPPDLIEIGSHTLTHPNLASLTGDVLAGELLESKRVLEEILQRKVISLSVPFGSYNQETLRAAREAGYKLVVTCDPVVARPGDSPLSVGRFKVASDDWDVEFRLKAAGAQQWRRGWQRFKGRPTCGNGLHYGETQSATQAEPTE